MSSEATRRTLEHAVPEWHELPVFLGDFTTDECAQLLAAPSPTVLLPIGSTEPHGPHLPLATDALLATEHARRSVLALRRLGVAAVAAPAIAYGVTNYAAGFAGVVTISPNVLEALVRETCTSFRAGGFALVCVLNHHLEPAHVDTITRAVESIAQSPADVVFANQLRPAWGRTLSAEFKRGNCHAGSYETSLVLAAHPTAVREPIRRGLPAIDASLSDAIRAGKKTFREIGLERAYTGAPADATRAEGDDQYQQLVSMVVSEVSTALERLSG